MKGDIQMKKVISIMIAMMLCLAIAGLASAETTIGKSPATMISTKFGGGVYAPSTGVTVNIKSITTAYCAASQHQSSNDTNGGLQYQTLSSDPAMPSKAATAASVGVPTACTNETTL